MKEQTTDSLFVVVFSSILVGALGLFAISSLFLARPFDGELSGRPYSMKDCDELNSSHTVSRM